MKIQRIVGSIPSDLGLESQGRDLESVCLASLQVMLNGGDPLTTLWEALPGRAGCPNSAENIFKAKCINRSLCTEVYIDMCVYMYVNTHTHKESIED